MTTPTDPAPGTKGRFTATRLFATIGGVGLTAVIVGLLTGITGLVIGGFLAVFLAASWFGLAW